MFCSKCGNELKDDAAFCSKCGAKTEASINEAERIEKTVVESTGPAAIDLKTALNLIQEVAEYIDQRENIDKSEYKGMERRLFDAEKILNKVKNTDPTVEVLMPGTNELINAEEAIAYNDYMGGRLGFDTITVLDSGIMSSVRALNIAQKNFTSSFNRHDTPWARFYYARAKHEEYNLKTKKTFMPQNKLKQEIIDDYQYIINHWPDEEWAIEARKYQTRLQ